MQHNTSSTPTKLLLLPLFLILYSFFSAGLAHAQPIFGDVTNPLATISPQGYGDLTGEEGAAGGLVGFISNVVKTITVVAGLYSMFNFIIAGMDYITSQGDPKGAESAKNKITHSIIGIVIVVGTFALTAMASRVLFGRYDAILKPTIYGPGSPST